MATLSFVRPRKEISSRFLCLLVCRALFSLVASSGLAQAWQTAPATAPTCQAAGQVFGWDLMDRSLTLKSDSGQYSDFRYDDSTTFTNNGAILWPDALGILEALNIDDRLCVEAFRGDNRTMASRVRVTFRAEIDARDKRDLVRWQADSLFGTVKSLDLPTHRIIVSVPTSSDVSVDATGSVALWIQPLAADDPADAVRGSLEKLSEGDAIYVRGDRVPGMRTMRARMIVSGGFRRFAGSVESEDVVADTIQLRDFRSGRSRTVHVSFEQFYATGKNTVPHGQDRRLYPLIFTDIREGDSVVVFGRENSQGGVDGALLVTGFSAGGVLQPGPGQSADWIFQAVGFGGQTMN
jgi:hypothetical protein